jgi:hypothetical protein
MKDGKPV